MNKDQSFLLKCLEADLKQIMQTKSGRRLFITSLPFLMTGCASSSKGGGRHREGDNTGQASALSVSDEQRMTKEYLPQMRKEYPTHPNKKAQDYIRKLGQKIVTANSLGGNPYNYTFTLVNAKMVNAFALPAGTVFVTAPLMKLAKSEAELAGVIGHEIGHIKARHTAERMAEAKKSKTKSILFGLGGAILGGAAGYGLGKALCKKQDRECLKRISMYGAAAGAGGGLLIQKFAFMANSREDEMEADRIGFKTSLMAGYHKNHIGMFYSRLLEMEKNNRGKQNAIMQSFADAMSTHPPSQERVQQMQEMASSSSNIGSRISSRTFKNLQKLI